MRLGHDACGRRPARILDILALAGGLAGCVLLLAAAGPARSEVITWAVQGGGNWNTATNWSPQDVPDQSGEEAVIPADGLAYTIELDAYPVLDRISLDNPLATLNLWSTTIQFLLEEGLTNRGRVVVNSGAPRIYGNLRNQAGAVFQVNAGQAFYMHGPTVTNHGQFLVNSESGSADAIVFLSGGVTLGGGGELVMRTSGDPYDARLQWNYGSLAQEAGHTIRGEGLIEVGIPANLGLVSADAAGRVLWLTGNPKSNNGVFQATGGGILRVSSVQISQGSGGVIRGDGGTVQFDAGTSITGGSLVTAGGGVIESIGSTELRDVTNLGDYHIPSGRNAFLLGSAIVNDGTIRINPDAGGGDAILYAGSYGLTVGGMGEIVLRTSGDPYDARLQWYYGDLTQAAGHTIRGEGLIEVGMPDNLGLISADAPGRALWMTGNPKTNNGVFQATGGGILRASSVQISQGSGGIIRGAPAGVVRFEQGTTLTGGSLETTGDGVIEATAWTELRNIANRGDLRIPGGGQVSLLGASIVNDGTIRVHSDDGGGDAILYAGAYGLTVGGTGEIVLATSGDPYDARIQWYYGDLTQSAGHTIRGDGMISVGMPANYGLVAADVEGGTLWLVENEKVNRGIWRASNHGTMDVSCPIRNDGVAEARGGGTFRVTNLTNHYAGGTLTGGSWHVHANSVMRFVHMPVSTCSASLLLDGPGSILYRDDGTGDGLSGFAAVGPGGRFEIRNGRDFVTAASFTNQGEVVVGEACSLRVTGAYVQSVSPPGRRTTVNGVMDCADSMTVLAGCLAGTGTVRADVSVAATACPGDPTGRLTIEGDYTQEETGWLSIDLAGREEGEFDHLAVSGTARLAGTLLVDALDGFEVAAGDSFRILSFSSREGDFDRVIGCPGPARCVELVYTDTSLAVVVFDIPAAGVDEPGNGHLPNGSGISGLPARVALSSRMAPDGGATLDLELPEAAEVDLGIFDLTGRRVALLHRGTEVAGSHAYHWGGSSDADVRVPSGIYFGRATVRLSEGTVRSHARVFLFR